MSMLLGDMNAIKPAPSNPFRSRKRKPSPPPKHRSNDHRSSSPVDACGGAYSDGFHDEGGASSDDLMSPKKKQRTDPAIRPALDGLTNLDVHSSGPEDTGMDDYDFGDNSLDDLDPSAFDQLDQTKPATLYAKPKVEPTEVDLKKIQKPLHTPAPSENKKVDNLGWMSYYDSLSVAKDEIGSGPSAFSSTTQDKISALEPDGSLQFFWLDYLEHDGKVHFIGKLKDKNSGQWVSCCVTIDNLQRNLYVLPRERRIEIDEDGDEYETDIVPSITDVYQEFDTFRKRAGVKTCKAKFVKRKYAFGERNVPREETQWLKVVYGFDGMWFTLVKLNTPPTRFAQNP
jgi:DNA polymerase alpha subunit A